MPKPSRVELLGFVGHGPNRIQARADAEQQIKRLSEGSWMPAIFEWLTDAVLVYRTAFGWEFTFIRHDGGPLSMRNGFTMPRSGSFEETRRAAIYALVQSAWRVGMAMDIFPDFCTDEVDRQELRSQRRQLLNIDRLRAEGHTLDEALNRTFEMRNQTQEAGPNPAGFGKRLEQKIVIHQFVESASIDDHIADVIKEKVQIFEEIGV